MPGKPMASGRLERGTVRTRVDEKRRAGAFGEREHGVEAHRFILVLASDREQRRCRAGALMGVKDAALGDSVAFGDQRLKADVVGA